MNIQHPEKHVFELIGHGNEAESKKGKFYQEEADLSRGFDSFGDTQKYGGPNITILQRRNLQILKARNERFPSLWIKPGIKSLYDLRYPLHFLDFEAATYSIPMKKQSEPYRPVYFQFSCFTLFENGELIHTEWLDQQDGKTHPHTEFVNRLGEIPNIFKGTIMQYSPFEKQGVNRLIRDLNKKPNQFKTQIEILKKISTSELPGYKNRFFDVSRSIRDFYFNKFFNDGLGLKQVLVSILQWERAFGSTQFPIINVGESEIDINENLQDEEIPDPYKKIQNSDFFITDGSAAMHAWLAFKNGLLTDAEQFQISEILKKYCALDSYGLFVIHKHISKLTESMENDDLIEFDG